MTPLRQRMIEDLKLHGYSDRTVEAYTKAVLYLARFYDRSPDQLTEEQARHYLVHLATVKNVARSTHTIALCGIKFFYQRTLGRQWNVLDVARPKKEKKLPVVLSRDEVRSILTSIRNPTYRVCLTTVYSCGLRLLEDAARPVTPDSVQKAFQRALNLSGIPSVHPRWTLRGERLGSHNVQGCRRGPTTRPFRRTPLPRSISNAHAP